MVRLATIMIVDDDEDDRLIFKDAVKEINASLKVIEAWNGEDCIQKLKELQVLPSLIFLDLNMPGSGGMQCLFLLKASISFRAIPVVMRSTARSEEDYAQAKKLGAMDFMMKAASFKEIKAMIEASLKKLEAKNL